MKKRLFPILLTVLMAFIIMPMAAGTVHAESGSVTIDGVTYTPNDDGQTAVVSGCMKEYLLSQIDIRSMVRINGTNYTVTSIGASAFQGCENLSGITIPTTVTSIGDAAFQLSGLTAITFANGSSLTSIGDEAFKQCYNLKSITIPAGVTSIGDGAFEACGELTTITFANESDLTSIGASAFQGCSGLTGITIPAGVTSIGASAFQKCYALVDIAIPAGVTSIGDYAFRDTSIGVFHYIGNETDWESITKGTNWQSEMYRATHCITDQDTRKATPDHDGYIDRYICNEDGWSYGGTVISRPVISLSETSFAYDGTVKKPTVIVKDGKGETIAGDNYTVTIRNSAGTQVTDPKDQGIYKVNVTMQGDKYEGTKVLAYTIGDPNSIQDANVVLSAETFTYNGTVQKPTIVTIGGMDLTEGADYTAEWSNASSTNAGTYTVTITGNEFYPGTTTASYTIDPKTVTVKANNASRTYGKNDPAEYTATVSGLLGTDTVTYKVAREKGNNAGTYAIIPTGETAQGNYAVSYKNGTFTINPKTVTPTVKTSNKVYTGKALKPAVTVRDGTVTLKSGTDYTVGYSNNKKAGKASARVTLKGNYKGSRTATFKILPKKAGISRAVPGKKLVKLTMSAKVAATGGTVYQIQYRIKTTTTRDKTRTIKKLKTGKQYQFKVRAYKSVSGTKYYGAWSGVTTTGKVK